MTRIGSGFGGLTLVALAWLAAATPAAAMSGGTAAPDPTQTPWMATLAVKGPAPLPDRASCGGTLVAADRVLTAAHCVSDIDTTSVEVHLGASVLSEEAGTVRGVQEVRVHPEYEILPSPEAPDKPELSSARNDIAEIRLDGPVTDIAPLRPVSAPPAPNTQAAVFGHGVTKADGGVSDVLNAGALTVTPDEHCAGQTTATVDGPSVLCAQDLRAIPRTVQGCFGDSGGPLVVRDILGAPRLAGVFSFAMETTGAACGTSGFNAFADVSALADDLD